MKIGRVRCSAPLIRMLVATLTIQACTDTPTTLPRPRRADDRAASARSTTALAVSSTDPSFGDQGTTLDVHVFGSGFAAGAQATWLLHGNADPAQVRTNNTTVISSTELIANITIASDATLDLWDVQVALSNGKNGVGSDLFEVTTAISLGTLGGNAEAHAASGSTTGTQVVGWSYVGSGQHAFAWPDVNGNMEDLGPGSANAIDVAGTTIAGIAGSQAALWTRSGSNWVVTGLPVQSGTPMSSGDAIASGADGDAALIGGSEFVSGKGHGSYPRPMIWKWDQGSWIRSPLPVPRSGTDVASAVHGVNMRGQAVGGVRNGGLPTQAVFWDSLGVAHILPGDGYEAQAIDAGGRIVAGMNSAANPTTAAYWTAEVQGDGSRTWSGPFELPGGCARALGVDDAGDIIGNRCATASSARYNSAVWVPPYTAAIELSGLGDASDAGAAWGISRDGRRIVGGAPTGGAPTGGGTHRVAVLWQGVIP